MVNFTCPVIPDKPSDPKPFFENGNIDFKAHDVGWLICGIMTLIATISSMWLVWKHLTYYTCPQQQRHIVRLLIMVPIYAIISFMSYLFYHEALYYQTIRDCYEAVLVTSFFYLILAYTGDTPAEQHAVFRNVQIKDRFWVWPLGSWKYKPEGLHFLWLMKICVLQYAILRPLCTFLAVGTEYFGYYCLHSWMPWFTHVWCALIISISVTVAVYCLIQLYIPVRKLVDPYKPILKFIAIKTIVFLTFWQDTLLSFLVSFNVIKQTEYFTGEQIQAGINALLQCFWMMLFGFIHIKAFSYLPYRPEDRSRTTLRGKAMLDSLDFRDWFFEMKESTRYMAARSKGRNYTLAEDLRAKRHKHLLNALGKERSANLDAQVDMEKANMPTFWKNPEDAQFWTPADQSDSAYASSQDAKSSSRPSNTGNDAYTSLPNPLGRGRSARQASKTYADKSGTTASRDSHTARAAELQSLVAELDLQHVDQSIVGAEDHDYGYQDEKYERAGLMRSEPSSSRFNGKKEAETPEKELHPELTQYHTPTVQLANVPSLSYDHDSASSSGLGGGKRRGKDLSAVAEEEDEAAAAGQGRVAPGVGAFGIAAWLGWNSQPQQQPTHAAAESDYFLHPGGSYGARVAAHTPDAEGTGWWRNYWDRVSNPGSREPSIVGIEEDEKQPLTTERPAVMRQVTAASWGIEHQPHNHHHQQRPLPLPQPPALKINTHSAERKGGEASVDSTTSPSSSSSLISPHVNSPLSRLIQTSRHSFSSRNRDEIREQSLAANSAAKPAAPVSKPGSPKVIVAPIATRPMLAVRNASIAPSSNQASLSRVASTTTNTNTARRSVPATASNNDSAARQMANEMLSLVDNESGKKHPIKYADALLPPHEVLEEELLEDGKVGWKKLAPAVGPKGKLVNLVLPNPLSPARFPYGQEGPAPPSNSAPEKEVAAPVSRREPSNGGGTLKWANQQPRPLKPKEEPLSLPDVKAKLPEGKGLITVGGMSLAQHKAQAQMEAHQCSSSYSANPTSTTPNASTPPKSILTSKPVGEGKLLLPAPSKLATAEAEDPYRATSTHTRPRTNPKLRAPERVREGGSVTTSAETKTSMTTAFQVGSIVHGSVIPFVALGSASGGGLGGYYDSIRSQHGQRGISGAAGGRASFIQASERHCYVPSLSGVRPAMLPPHPAHQPQQQYPYAPGPQQRGQGNEYLPPHLRQPQQQQQQQYGPPSVNGSRFQPHPQPQPYPPQQQLRYSHPHPQQPQQQRDYDGHDSSPYQSHRGQGQGQGRSQFQYEYYRD
ncbi:uncharacterized protein UDID_06112 [Ustilago sp. UG-2017a]|nr:uncharacterized protein UDID_06112 [Ustilago sp. UG-2017a]